MINIIIAQDYERRIQIGVYSNGHCYFTPIDRDNSDMRTTAIIKIICLFIILFLATAMQDLFSHPTDPLLLRLTIKNNNVSKYEDMILDLKIQSKYKKNIFIPHYMSYGFLNDSTGTGYASLQVQKMKGNTYNDVPLDGILDNIPLDNQDTLTFNKIRHEEFYFGGNFRSDKGEYRARILCFFSSNNHDVQDALSNWVYFQCKNDVRRYNSKNSR